MTSKVGSVGGAASSGGEPAAGPVAAPGVKVSCVAHKGTLTLTETPS